MLSCLRGYGLRYSVRGRDFWTIVTAVVGLGQVGLVDFIVSMSHFIKIPPGGIRNW
jgi:hypothetical protein